MAASRFVRAVAVLVLVLGQAALAVGDRLELVNGDVITGTIRQMDATTVVIETEYGVLEIQRDRIVRGEFGRSAGEVADSLLMSFDFDGRIVDKTGYYRAVNNGMRFVPDRNGNPSAALRSDGTGTYLSIAPTDEVNSLDQFTLSFFVNLEDLTATRYLVSKWYQAGPESADGKFTMQTSAGNITLYLVAEDGSYHRLTAPSALEPGVWTGVAVTFADGRATIYVDGTAVASQRFSFTSLFVDDSPLLIMTALATGDDQYGRYNAVGAIDDLRLYSRALSPDEVALLAGVGGL